MSNTQRTRPWLMKIRPLWLREKLFWKLYFNKTSSFSGLFENAALEFSPLISLKLIPTDISHQQIALLGFCELLPSRQIAQLGKAGGLMVDVGANYGYYSCLWAASNPQNRVIAFEASPKNISALKENLIKNGLETQIEVHQIAVGKEGGSLPFSLGPDEQTGWGGLLTERKEGTIEVPVISLDELLFKSDNQRINVLKIDTEGADTWVLQGAEQLLKNKRIDHIFFEENVVRMSALGIKPGVAQELLLNYGYRLEPIGKGEWYAKI